MLIGEVRLGENDVVVLGCRWGKAWWWAKSRRGSTSLEISHEMRTKSGKNPLKAKITLQIAHKLPFAGPVLGYLGVDGRVYGPTQTNIMRLRRARRAYLAGTDNSRHTWS